MKRVLIDLEENGCTVKEAVDYLKGLGYREDDDYPIRYNAVVLVGYKDGTIDFYTDYPYETSVNAFCKKHSLEKLTIKEKQGDQGDLLTINLSTDQALFLYRALMGYPLNGVSKGTVDIFNGAFEKVERCVSSDIGFDPVCVKTPSEREMNGDEFFRFSCAVKGEMMKSEQEAPIVFSNPLMQHIGREVVVNDGRGDFTGWVVGVYDHYSHMFTVDIGVEVWEYTHGGQGGVGISKGTLRWFYPRFVKFVNEDGSLSDE